MALPIDPGELSPVKVDLSARRKTLVQIQKQNVADLEVCHPKVFIRERPFWRGEKMDVLHLLPGSDGYIKHTPVE